MKGHQLILNIILFAELTTVVFGMIIKGEFLSATAESGISIVVLIVALLAWPDTPPTFQLILSTFCGINWVLSWLLSVTKP